MPVSPTIPRYQRSLFPVLVGRLREPRRFLQVITGPRQVGKTTLIRQAVAELEPDPSWFVRSVSADDATGNGRDWLVQVWTDARTGLALSPASQGVLCIDEIQRIDGWSQVVKACWDADTATGTPLHVVVSGSSRLLLQHGLGESLMGRFELSQLGHWSLTEMRDAFGLTPEQYAWFGGYPGAAPLIEDEARFTSYIADSVVEASLSRDVFLLDRVDKPAALRRLYDLAIAYCGQIVSLTKLLEPTQAGNTTTLTRYLTLLSQAGLVSGLDKFSTRPLAKTAMPKFQPHTMALVSAAQSVTLAQAQADSALWGRVVESAVGAHLLTQTAALPNATLAYWRERDAEVDFVVTAGDQVVGIEVKSVPTAASHAGLAAFRTRFPKARTVLVGPDGLDWREFLATDLGDLLAAVG